MKKLAFTTSIDTDFVEGAIGLIKSIRRFHGDTVDIIVFVDRLSKRFMEFAIKFQVEIATFDTIESWVNPIIYTDARFLNDTTHFYHPDFYIRKGWPDDAMDRIPGLGVHHLHPLNCKAYCTGFCLCIREYQEVIHIDADAFLLSNVSSIFEGVGPNAVIAFDDGEDDLRNLENFYGVTKPPGFSSKDYAFNAGVVFYSNGPGVQKLAKDFMFYIDSCYHYTHAGYFADQGVLRSLVAKHHILGNIHFLMKERTNWNPTWSSAEDIFLNDQDEWVNRANNKKQFIWHGAGAPKLWTGNYKNEAVLDAWRWICQDGNNAPSL
jgi:hypothetical protein